MKFTLTYEGPLRPQKKADVAHKHDIRTQLSQQLEMLWKYKPLSGVRELAFGERTADLAGNIRHQLDGTEPPKTDGWLIQRSGDYFLPIVLDQLEATASLSITWFRQEEPGKILQVGDIDNRLKTLCDALQVPPVGQLPAGGIGATRSSPFYCIFEDDALISGFSIQTERLLKPSVGSQDVLLLIEVVTSVNEVQFGNMHLI